MKHIWLFFALLFISGCAVDNNYLQPQDITTALEKEGLRVESVRQVLPDPFRATSGVAISIDGSEIGVYKYDQTSRIQRKRLDSIAESRRTYINGIPYPVVVHGSFMIMGLDKNKKKRQILKALKHFK
jgi:hypothetical protein